MMSTVKDQKAGLKIVTMLVGHHITVEAQRLLGLHVEVSRFGGEARRQLTSGGREL